MATISKVPIVIQGFPRFVKEVKYSARDHRFFIPLPQFMHGPLGMEEVTGNTEREVEDIFKKKLEETKKLNTEVSKVILYRIEYDGDSKVSLSVVCIVANQMKSSIEERVSNSYETLPSSLLDYDAGRLRHRDFEVIPWSEAAEAKFKSILDDIRQLTLKLKENGEVKESRYSASTIKVNLESSQ